MREHADLAPEDERDWLVDLCEAVTYDICGMSGEAIVQLLPVEFDVWRGREEAAA